MKKLFPILTLALLTACGYGESVTFNGTEVYYKDGATLEDAEKLGEYLVESEFADGVEKSVMIVKNEDGEYVFRMVVQEGAEEGNDALFGLMAMGISMSAFDGEPVHFEACDVLFNTLKTVPYSSFGSDDEDSENSVAE